MELAPIVLFVYNRLWHTQQTVEALKKNELAKESELFVFSDAPQNKDAVEAVKRIREYIKTINGFKNITIIEREKNFGLARSFIEGTTQILNNYSKMIGLEDDNYSSPFFLRFMNEALDLYASDESVICISGYSYPTKKQLPEIYFLRGAETWGYGTWRKSWKLFESDGKKLLQIINENKMSNQINLNDSFDFMNMLKMQIENKIDSWGIRWYVSAVINKKFTLYPGKALVMNIGFDGSGRHCTPCKDFDVELSEMPILVKKIEVKEDMYVVSQIEEFYRSLKPNIYKRIKNKAVYLIGKILTCLKNLFTHKK